MTTEQILLYLLLAAVVLFGLRRFLKIRSVKHYSPSETAEKLAEEEETVMLDVRTAGERNAQHIRGSLHIPLQELTHRLDELKKYQQREIICYCRSGNRSLTAAALLKKHGFMAANMRGGIVEWKFSGLR
jgi:rhodanese-related sulfurtransferase